MPEIKYEPFFWGQPEFAPIKDDLIREIPKPAIRPIKIQKEEKLNLKPKVQLISNLEIEGLAMNWQFIDKVGIELEGAWIELRTDLINDLSFNRDDFDYRYKSVGEYVSQPMSNSDKLFREIRNNYPDYAKPARQQQTCAFHVHFSFKSPEFYATCMNPKFYEGFLQEMTRWGRTFPCDNEEFWKRLNGENKYCKKEFNPDFQASFHEKGHNRQSRRTQLNYCYFHTGTIECRIFPVFESPKTAIYAAHALLSYVEKFVSENPLRELSVKNTLSDGQLEENDKQYNEVMEKIAPKFKLSKFNLFSDNNHCEDGVLVGGVEVIEEKVKEVPF